MKSPPPPTALLVVALCRREVVDATLATATAAMPDVAAFQALLACADRLRVSGHVLAAIANSPTVMAAVPWQVSRRIRVACGRLRRLAAAYDLERDRLMAVMARHHVEPTLLKGAGLRATLYRDAPWRRHTGDIDLLVPERFFHAAVAAAESAGYTRPSGREWQAYRRHHFHLRLTHPLGYELELHWALTEPESPFRLDADAFVRSASSGVPHSVHAVLHLAFENAHERFENFSRLVDIDRLVSRPGFDWEGLVRSARVSRLDVALGLTLQLCTTLLGTTVPPRPARLCRGAAAFHLGLLHPADRLLAPDQPRRSASDRLMDLWLVPGAIGRLRALATLASARGYLDPLHRELGHLAPVGIVGRAAGLTKLAVYQMVLYAGRGRHR